MKAGVPFMLARKSSTPASVVMGNFSPPLTAMPYMIPEAARISQRLLQGQPALQVSVIVHHRIALLIHLQQLAINVVHLRQLIGGRLQVIGQGLDHQIAELHFGQSPQHSSAKAPWPSVGTEESAGWAGSM